MSTLASPVQPSLFPSVDQPAATPVPAQGLALVNTPFNYTGSKFKLLEQLLPLFDYSKPYFIDMFTGGGSVYTNVAHRYERVVANDIINDLIGAHVGLIRNTEAFVAEVRALCVAKDDQAGYHKLRDSYNAAKTPAKLLALMLCCTNNMMRFNQKFLFNQTFGKRTFNDKTAEKIAAFAARMQPLAGRVTFTSRSFTNIWPKNPRDTFFYFDPPYSGTEAGYNSYWSEEQERFLYDYIHRVNQSGGTFALSGVAGMHREGEQSWIISKLIADGFNVTFLDHDYEKVARVKDEAESREVVIRNFS